MIHKQLLCIKLYSRIEKSIYLDHDRWMTSIPEKVKFSTLLQLKEDISQEVT